MMRTERMHGNVAIRNSLVLRVVIGVFAACVIACRELHAHGDPKLITARVGGRQTERVGDE